MAKIYVEKARQVTADQFLVATTPWPPGVDQCEAMPSVPHFHYPNGVVIPINDTDWVLAEHRTGAISLMSDTEFRGTFNVPGPTMQLGDESR